jgi:hypothetical protein
LPLSGEVRVEKLLRMGISRSSCPLDQITQQPLPFHWILHILRNRVVQMLAVGNHDQLLLRTGPGHVELARGFRRHLTRIEHGIEGELSGSRATWRLHGVENDDRKFERLHGIDRAHMNLKRHSCLAQLPGDKRDLGTVGRHHRHARN